MLAAAVSAAVYAENLNKEDDLFSVNVDALADCEISNKGGEIIFSCSGENTCSVTYLGKTLTCDGTQH